MNKAGSVCHPFQRAILQEFLLKGHGGLDPAARFCGYESSVKSTNGLSSCRNAAPEFEHPLQILRSAKLL